MNKIIQKLDYFIFSIAYILFGLIPLALMFVGGSTPLYVVLNWYFRNEIRWSDLWYIVFGLLICWIGFKGMSIIDPYQDALERNNKK